MKIPLFITALLSTSVFAQQDWVDLPDGFVWEEPLANQGDFTTYPISTRILSNTLRDAILGEWPDDSLPPRLTIAEVDLNGDGAHEVFVGVPGHSGTGGTAFMILSPVGDRFKSVGSVFGFGFEFLSTHDGWIQIKGHSRGGGGYHTRYLSQFNGAEYEDVRIENHNMIDRSVVIREPKKQNKAEMATPGKPSD